MMAFSLWKQLKRRLRRNRKPLWTLGSVAWWMFACLTAAILLGTASATAYAEEAEQPSVSRYLADRNDAVPVMLRRIYVCGEETEMLGRLESEQIIALLRENSEWSATLDQDGQTVVLAEQIEDLSNHCKSHAYFGVDRKGNFSLFDGIPQQEKVMRTFFQLDIRFLESSLPKDELDHLSRGIRVSDIDEYNSVLSTFSDYAVGREKVLDSMKEY
ncbi:BofC C-terminal domain-containing protein [Paenibacillus soyae]|uniref:BofC C-terminal domain-containing protein n=1 Tax=Paenibacillus soyae TaxID=2969249 RepID=A0A9X2MM65_9BACL|nr:BofC C-terminal domain-containing protein [Paenibacillus soyae]MCR2802649.1 BofC C-terminal domain-containing protein [Paenibacillus soyae]